MVEIPDMGSPEAIEQREKFKHVKPHEHLWYFTSAQIAKVLENNGFSVVGMEIPVSGKVAVYATPQIVVTDVTVMGPPGIGDTLWTLHKLKGIREREAPCRLKYVVCSDPQQKPAIRARDLLLLCPYIDSVEFRRSVWPMDVGCKNPKFPLYELVANDYLEPQGGLIENWRPELPSDFDLGIQVPDGARKQVRWRLGPNADCFAVLYFSSAVWNRTTVLPHWTPQDWAQMCIQLNSMGIKPVILGADWDVDYVKEVAAEIMQAGEIPSRVWVNLVDRTPLITALAYMEGAAVTIGVCAGLPMMAAYLGWPTIIFWPTRGVAKTAAQFGAAFKDNWIPPNVRCGGSYLGLDVGSFSVADLMERALNVIRGKQHAHTS